MIRLGCLACGHEHLAADDVRNQMVNCGDCGDSFVAAGDALIHVPDGETLPATALPLARAHHRQSAVITPAESAVVQPPTQAIRPRRMPRWLVVSLSVAAGWLIGQAPLAEITSNAVAEAASRLVQIQDQTAAVIR